MIKKIFSIAMFVWIVGLLIPMPVTAADDSLKFSFELSVDGKDTVEVNTGDIITVVLKLKREDASKPYTMYAMQDEIRYDSTFFELVEGSAVLYNGVSTTDIAMVDQYREFYMNYLSMSGGTQWEDETVVGSVQFKITGKSGVSKITNQDNLVSLEDGSGSYPCGANEVTVVLTTDCKVEFMTNGGSEIEEQIVQFGEKVEKPEDPVREGYKVEGWYSDIHLTDEWDFEEDTVDGNMSLYTKWGEEEEEEAETETTNYWWLLFVVFLIIIILIIKKVRDKK